MPEVERALIAGHDLVLLGERGQGKTRLIRTLVGLLDEWTPVLVGSELNEHPLQPISVVGAPADRRARRRDPGRLAAPQRPLRREAGDARHQRRRPDRRRRPDQGGRGPHARRPGDRALRPGAAHQPRHLQRQRAARPGRADPGGAAQRAGGARHPDPRLPGAAAAGPAARGQRQPRGLHQPRPDHHPAQGPVRRRGAHPLPDRAGRRDPAAAPGGAASWRGGAGGTARRVRHPARPRAPGRDRRPLHPAGARVQPRRPALRRQRPVRHRRAGDDRGLRRPPGRRRRGDPAGGAGGRPAERRPGQPRQGGVRRRRQRPRRRAGAGGARAPAAAGDRADLPRPLRRAGPHRPAGALHRRRRPSSPASWCPPPALLGQLGTIPKLAELLGRLGVPEGEQSAEQAAAAVEFALEGLYLTRRLAKDTDGTRTVYGA